MSNYTEIFLLCHTNYLSFSKGKTYHGPRNKDDPDFWSVKDDRDSVVYLHETITCQFFHRAFFEDDFKNVCNNHPELIETVPKEWLCTFNYFFDNAPKSLKSGERTVDAPGIKGVIEKIKGAYPNAFNLVIRMA